MIRRTLLAMVTLALFGGANAEAAKVSQVYISEVLYNPVGVDGGNQLIELVNRGSTAQSLNPWSICIQFLYKNFPVGASIPAGGRYTIHINTIGSNTATDWYTGTGYVNIDVTGDAISLYHTTSGFTTSGNMEDFVQFGAGGQPRENVGVAAGFWTAGTFVPLGAEGQSVQFVPAATPPATRHPITDYCNAPPTIGVANACGPPPMGTLDDLRITEVLADPMGPEAGATRAELINTSALPTSLDGLTFRIGGSHFTVPNGLTAPAGGLILVNLNSAGAPGWLAPLSDARPGFEADVTINAVPFVDLTARAGSFSLYRNALDFASPANMVDFLAWGAAGQGDDSVAVARGIWPAGAYFPEVAEGSSIQWRGTNNGNSPDDWCSDVPTL
ncbi:MAG TPA: lamin tail domain-containing protein, partial [Candidatus Eisenbacteria bacterium]